MPDAPPEAWPVSSFIQEELEARGWSIDELAWRMEGNAVRNRLVLDTLYAVHKPSLVLDQVTADKLARAFGVDAEYFMNLDQMWRNSLTPDA